LFFQISPFFLNGLMSFVIVFDWLLYI
jgi:hypothetical protein